LNVLVTGNNGYIGSILTKILLEKEYRVTGLDTNFYEAVDPDYQENPNINQLTKDARNITKNDLKGINAIIHLAALSNDPLGEFKRDLTTDINYKASIRLAKLTKDLGIERFVYVSSQSMYGISDMDEELREDDSKKNPLTEYAKTKWRAECELKELGSRDFTVVCFRPSTVYGASPKLRCDIVYNNFVGCAYTTGKIEIKSDGTPWRPAVHIRDVSNAFIAGLEAPVDLVSSESFNIGVKNGNYTVRELAEAAQKVVKDSKLMFTGEHGVDSRTYRVSFEKILTVLKDYYKPKWDLDKGGKELVSFFDRINFTEENFRSRSCIRLSQLKYLVDSNLINDQFHWV
jgi:nucleoside-diphosphate-sugar epimerase